MRADPYEHIEDLEASVKRLKDAIKAHYDTRIGKNGQDHRLYYVIGEGVLVEPKKETRWLWESHSMDFVTTSKIATALPPNNDKIWMKIEGSEKEFLIEVDINK